MKNLICQTITYNPNSPGKSKLYVKCSKTIQRYAKNINCDYLLEEEQWFGDYPPHFEVYRIFEDKKYFNYDKILFIDADVFALNTKENIFEYYDNFSACRHNDAKPSRPEFKVSKDFLNSGIVIFDQKSREKIKPYYKEEMKLCSRIIPGRDQLALNRLVFNHLGGYTQIDPKHACYLKNKESSEAILVHLAGRNRHMYNDAKDYWDTHFEIQNEKI